MMKPAIESTPQPATAVSQLEAVNPRRREFLSGITLGSGAAAFGWLSVGTSNVQAASLRAIRPQIEGPYYPPAAWRSQWTDWDADLTRVNDRPGAPLAKGELLGLEGDLVDTSGRTIDGAAVEIWQCDSFAVYRAPNHAREAGKFDPNFAGFGTTRSSSTGTWRFRTIRPVPYTIRTPHIHVKLRHPSFGEIASQLFVAGEPLNGKDFLWPGIANEDRAGLALQLKAAPPGSGLRWLARHRLVVPA